MNEANVINTQGKQQQQQGQPTHRKTAQQPTIWQGKT
jgi:hypothetical protein